MKRSSSVPASVATASGLPSRLGKYELLMPLATGGMARIYIARTTGIGSFERHVVLKLITPERANDHTAVQMFLDEARLAASLNHQNVAQVFEVGEDAGIHYLAMEYVHGQDLRALLAKAGGQGSRIPLELALTVVAGAAAGLNHAHERRGADGTPLGIVHRDVSPSNIMIGYDGSVKLLDFGIAKATSRSVETQSGIIKGKFAYMAPEQCRGRDVDRRSDVFSLGIILYEITTQHRCFRADSDFDTMHRIVTGDVVRPTRLVQGYPQALEAIVMKALAVDANQRYQSAGLLLEAVESYSVSARMSLSTMGLGRFMREMFGDVTEPWLTSAARDEAAQVAPKENTISSTDGRGSGPIAAAPPSNGAVAEEEDEAYDSGGQGSLAGKTILDLPRDPAREPEPSPAEWNDAKAYPASQPAIASSMTLPPDAMAAQAYAPGIAVGRTPTPGQLARPSQPHVLGQVPAGSQPVPLVPAGAFATPPSSSGPAMTGMSGVHGMHGYPARGDLGYPRYEPPPEPPAEVSLGVNRKPLIVALGIAVVGVGVLLALLLHGGKSHEAAPAAAPQGSDQAVDPGATTTAPAPAAAQAAGSAAPAAPSESVDDFISVHVDSTPRGADVLIAGTKIGTTPLDKKLKRGSQLAPLTIHLAGYVDVHSKIDFAADFEANPTLQPESEEPIEEDGSGSGNGSGSGKGNGSGSGSGKGSGSGSAEATSPSTSTSTSTSTTTKPVHEVKTPVVEHHLKTTHTTTTKTTPTEHPHPTTTKPAQPRGQPPGAYNPFDTSCSGQPCPVCK